MSEVDGAVFTLPAERLSEVAVGLLASRVGEDPLRPRLLIAASKPSARSLLDRVAQGAGAVATVWTGSLPDLAREMAAPRCERWVLPPGADRLIVADWLERNPGPFEAAAARPAIIRAVARSLRDLREAGLTSLPPDAIPTDEGRRRHERMCHLARLLADFQAHLERHSLADDALLYGMACEGAPPLDATETLLAGVYDLTGVQQRLVLALARRTRLTWLFPLPAEDSPARAAAEEMLEWAESNGLARSPIEGLEPRGGPEERVVACPGERAEAREVVRDLLRAAEEGIGFGEMAVLLPAPERTERLYRRLMEAAGIPVAGEDRRRLLDLPRGRSILAAVELCGERPTIDDLAAVLQRPSGGESSPRPLARVLAALRAAGCSRADPEHVSGRLEASRQSLLRRAERLRQRAKEEGAESTRLAARATVLLAEAEELAALASEAELWLESAARLRHGLAQAANAIDWSRAAHALATYARAVPWDEDLARPALEAAALIAGFARLAVRPRPDTIRELWLERLWRIETDLTTSGRDPRRQGEGVLLIDWNRARGLRARASWLTGLAQDLFHPAPAEDPVIDEGMRRSLSQSTGTRLKLAADRHREQDLVFALGLGAGEARTVISWPRFDDATGQLRYPADPLARLIETRSGSRLDTRDPAATPGVERIPAGPPHPGDRRRPLLDGAEYDLAVAHHRVEELAGYLTADPDLARRRRLDRSRFGTTRFNQTLGIVDDALEPPGHFTPTELETLATCPFRYFLSARLELRPTDEVDVLGEPARREVGEVVHAVLADVFRRAPEEQSGARDPGEVLGRLDRWVDLRIREALAQGAGGSKAIWRGVGEAIKARLAGYVAAELRRLRDSEIHVASTEEIAHGEVAVGASTVFIAGRPDRIDRGADGAVEIIDYKWSEGRERPSGAKLLRGGRFLQLPLYALLATRDEVQAAAVSYVYLRAPGAPRCSVPARTLAQRKTELDHLLADLIGFVERGEFFPVPLGGQNCRGCDYRPVCGARMEWIEARHAEDPRYLAHASLAENYP